MGVCVCVGNKGNSKRWSRKEEEEKTTRRWNTSRCPCMTASMYHTNVDDDDYERESLYHTKTIIIAYWVVVIRLPKFSASALHPFRFFLHFFSLSLTFV